MKQKNLPYMGYAEGLSNGFVVRDVELLKNIMIKDFDYFPDRRTFDAKGDPHIGKMLIFLKGEEWKQMRSALSPTFTTGKIKRMFNMFQATGRKFVRYIHTELGQGNISYLFQCVTNFK